MKFKVWKNGFSPILAAGPAGEDDIRHGWTWTPEETEKHRELEKDFEIVESDDYPLGLHMRVDDTHPR